MNKPWYLTILVLLCAASLSFAMGGGGGGGGAQKAYAGFQGAIKDQDGNPLNGVEVSLSFVDHGGAKKVSATNDSEERKVLSTSTRKNGKYRFLAVRPGYYRLQFSMDGYQTVEKLIEIKQGSKDLLFNIELKRLQESTASAGGEQKN